MKKPKHSPAIAATRLFTPKYREHVLEHLIEHFRADDRIAGVLLVGSASVGFDDGYSDIDLCVVVNDDAQRATVFKDWGKRLHNLFLVLEHIDVMKGEKGLLHVMLLEGFLELDLGFESLDTLMARRMRWRIAYDRSDKIEAVMQASMAKSQKNRPNIVRTQYENRIETAWHYIMHAVVAVCRRLPWKAIAEIEELRRQTVELRGLREDLETKRFRYADRLSPEFLESLSHTFVSPRSQPAEMLAAIRHLTDCFFAEARALDALLGVNYAESAEQNMRMYLNCFPETF